MTCPQRPGRFYQNQVVQYMLAPLPTATTKQRNYSSAITAQKNAIAEVQHDQKISDG